jgi:uncharacterized repeat protein (TIGR03803 family)
VLKHFTANGTEGYLPVAAPVEGPGNLLYGSTYFGGVDDAGTLYSVRKDGSGFTQLHDFLSSNLDGIQPNAPLLRGSDGALYGTTYIGGGFIYGTVFRIKPVALRLEKSQAGTAVHFQGFAGHRYALESSDGMPAVWTEAGNVTNLTGNAVWIDESPGTNRFFRARIIEP